MRLFIRSCVPILLVLLLAPAMWTPAPAKEQEPPPIRWLEWQQATLRQAENDRRPVLLFLTAAWCVECKQMEEEVLYDPQVRERIVESFLPILVDRDRRPDLFARYTRGGLPSIAFTLPTGNSIFFNDGGEFLRAGGANLTVETLLPYLDLVERQYKRSADAMDSMVKNWLDQARMQRNLVSLPLQPDMAARAANIILRLQDPVNGGLKGTLREVRSEPMRAALEHYVYSGEQEYRAFAERTLTALSRGAVRNPLDGSFYRLAGTPDWGSPSAEQLLHTQAEMLLAYLEAYRVLGDERYLEVARQLTDVLMQGFFLPEQGTFLASRVPEDPAQARWSWKSFRKALKRPQLDAAALRYGMDASADTAPRHLRDAMDAAEVAVALSRPEEEISPLLEAARNQLQAAWAKRVPLRIDTVFHTGWNAEAANALLNAWTVLGREDARDAALGVLDYVRRALTTETDGVFHGMILQPPRILPGVLLWDQNQMARGCLTAFQVTGEPRYRECSIKRLDFVAGRFMDKEWGALTDRRPAWGDVGEEGIPDRRIEENAEAAILMFELGALVPGDTLWKDGQKILEAFADEFASYGVRAIPMSLALHRNFQFPAQIAVVEAAGDERDPLATELRRAALRALPVWKVVLPLRDGVDDELMRGFGILPGEGTGAYLIQGRSNRGPFRTVEELEAALAPPEDE